MSKRAIFLLILSAGAAIWLMLLSFVELPGDQDIESVSNTNRGWLIAAFAALAGAISAAVTVARVPGRWKDKFDTKARPKPFARRWLWPVFMITLSVANFVIALAVFAGNALVTSKKTSDGL